MTGLGLGVAEHRLDRFAGQLQEARERAIRRFFAPFPEQVESEEQRVRADFRAAGRKPVELLDQDRNDRVALKAGSLDRCDRQGSPKIEKFQNFQRRHGSLRRSMTSAGFSAAR